MPELPRRVRPRARPGHHQLALAAVRRTAAASSRWRSANSRSTSRSPAGSNTTPARSGTRSAHDRSKRCAQPARRRATSRAIGITNQRETTVLWDRATGEPIAPRHRLAGPPHRRRLRAAARRRPRAEIAAQHRAAARSVFLRHQARLAARPRARRARARGARRARVRHDRQLAAVQAHRRPASRHRRHQRQPHAAARPAHAATGTTELLELLRRAARRACREVVDSCLSAVARRRRSSSAAPDYRSTGIAGDQQAALFGQACFAPGMAKNTYGTGCFALMNTGDDAASRRGTACSPPWPGAGGDRQLRARRRRLHGRRHGAVAARRPRHHPSARARSRRWRASVPDTGDVYLVPAFAGLGAPHWDAAARGTHRRPHARHRRARTSRAPRSRASRSRPPTSSTPCSRTRPAARRAARRRRRRAQRPAAAVPGRLVRRAGAAARRTPKPRPSARRRSPASASGFWQSRSRTRGALDARKALRAAHERATKRRAPRALASGAGAFTRLGAAVTRRFQRRAACVAPLARRASPAALDAGWLQHDRRHDYLHAATPPSSSRCSRRRRRADSPQTRGELDELLDAADGPARRHEVAARTRRSQDRDRSVSAARWAASRTRIRGPAALRRARRSASRTTSRPYVRAAKDQIPAAAALRRSSRACEPCIDNVRGDLSYPSGHADLRLRDGLSAVATWCRSGARSLMRTRGRIRAAAHGMRRSLSAATSKPDAVGAEWLAQMHSWRVRGYRRPDAAVAELRAR